MLNNLIEKSLEVLHWLLGALFYRVDNAKRRNAKKKKGFSIIKKVSDRRVTLDGSRGFVRKWHGK